MLRWNINYIRMSKVVMDEIIDNVYFQKLGVILTHLQEWQKKKNQVVGEVYSQCVSLTFQKMQRNHVELKNQITQFNKMLNVQYYFLSRIKKEQKSSQISSSFREFKEFVDEFETIKEGLINLNDFLGKFIGATNCEFSQLKQIYEQTASLKYQYEQYSIKANQRFNQKKELIYSKKNIRKHFQLSKILQLIMDINKDKEYHNQLSFKLYSITIQEINSKLKMYKNICDNLDYISGLYQKCFRQDFLQKVKRYFKDRFQGIQNQKERLNRLKLDTNKTDCAYKELQDEFYSIFDEFLNEITIARWKVLFTDRSKQLERKSENQRDLNMILTFDNKILFYKQEEKDISLQISLEDLKVNDPTPDGIIELKNRKNKDKFNIQFGTVEKEDEFYLHYQQVAQMI